MTLLATPLLTRRVAKDVLWVAILTARVQAVQWTLARMLLMDHTDNARRPSSTRGGYVFWSSICCQFQALVTARFAGFGAAIHDASAYFLAYVRRGVLAAVHLGGVLALWELLCH